MTTITKSEPDLVVAILEANKSFSTDYTVLSSHNAENPKDPVYLQLKYKNGSVRDIGITHLVHLNGKNWDEKPFEEVARTTSEVALSVLRRIALFFDAEKRGLPIDKTGTIFDPNGLNVEFCADETFKIDGTTVTYNGAPLLFTRLKSEGILQFRKESNGHISILDGIDKREGKGIYVDLSGKIYRA